MLKNHDLPTVLGVGDLALTRAFFGAVLGLELV
jgi:catechol 2,3-dioxygenase-like lactoylglutathione lyase family enzyme